MLGHSRVEAAGGYRRCVSPPPDRRAGLTRAALELLESEGPEAVSTRKVAARYGASTMAVYSEFGSLKGLVASVVEQGFTMLADALRAVAATDDPIADLVGIGRAYRSFALGHPHLYRVIYAVSPLAGHRRSGEELLQGADAFGVTQGVVTRAFRAGRMTVGNPYVATFQVWTAMHGMIVAELSGYLEAMPASDDDPIEALARTLAVGLGDDDVRARASVRRRRAEG